MESRAELFDKTAFLGAIHEGRFEEACRLLDQPNAETVVSEIDSKTKTYCLHEIARSDTLNRALHDKTPHAKEALTKLIEKTSATTLLSQEKTTGFTPFLSALDGDCPDTAEALIDILNLTTDRRPTLLLSDKKGNSALHHAVIKTHDSLIKKIIDIDRGKHLFFRENDDGLHAFALAMDCYQKAPTVRTMSILNQLLFSVAGVDRTLLVQSESCLRGDFLRHPIWQHGVEFCIKRDEKGKAHSIDLNWLDFVQQAITDGLNVMGMTVDRALLYFWITSEFNEATLHLFQQAFLMLEAGLAHRTLAQTAVNKTLAANRDFMRRAAVDKTYYLLHLEGAPTTIPAGIDDNLPCVILFTDTSDPERASKLLYLEKKISITTLTDLPEISSERLRPKNKAFHKKLCEALAAVPKNVLYPASPRDIEAIKVLTTLAQGPGAGMARAAGGGAEVEMRRLGHTLAASGLFGGGSGGGGGGGDIPAPKEPLSPRRT